MGRRTWGTDNDRYLSKLIYINAAQRFRAKLSWLLQIAAPITWAFHKSWFSYVREGSLWVLPIRRKLSGTKMRRNRQPSFDSRTIAPSRCAPPSQCM